MLIVKDNLLIQSIIIYPITPESSAAELQLINLPVSQIQAISGPPVSQLRTLKSWLYHERGGNSFLQAAETFTWKSDKGHDYVSLKRISSENDMFSRFIKHFISFFFQRVTGKKRHIIDEEAGIASYDDEKLDNASNFIAVVVSSTLPVLTIFALNALHTTKARLGLTVLFTAAFAALLAIFSQAKRAEIFAATAT